MIKKTNKSLDGTCRSLFDKICEKYDNLAKIDKLASVATQVESVKLVMQENVDIVLQNCVKLETIAITAEDLIHNTGIYYKRNYNYTNESFFFPNINTPRLADLKIV
jgi:hypothetical protein